MSTRLLAFISAGLILTGCGHDAGRSTYLASPVGPTAGGGSGSVPPSAKHEAFVPFRSEITWAKIPGSEISLCTRALPDGKIYLMRNTNRGIAVTTHLGTGEYENHTCVYGTPGKPEGWFADIRWTAANGDVLVATSDFLYWTGKPGQSVAVDKVTFHNGGTGRFEYAEGDGMCYVDAPARTAMYEGTLRYGKKDK